MTDIQPALIAILAFLTGAVVGTAINLWSILLVGSEEDATRSSSEQGRNRISKSTTNSPWWELLPLCGLIRRKRPRVFQETSLGWSATFAEIGVGLLFVTVSFSYLFAQAQQVSEVRPDDIWRDARLIYQLVLVALLAAATATDFRDYVIPDAITMPGLALGLLGAGLAGQLQIIHLWVDWNQEIPGVQGPYLPEWLDVHRHLHGFAWSAAGAIVGGGITWLARFLSQLVLRRESMGLGDVTLMAMIGSFIGWQPVLLVFFLAPLFGFVVAPLTKLLSGRAMLPYGPCLSAATVGLLCGWRWLWAPLRQTFGDWRSLAIISLVALVAFLALLAIMRRFQLVPAEHAADD